MTWLRINHLRIALGLLVLLKLAESKIYDVIVIGGGAAGLATAASLAEYGHKNLLVLEARDRLGGRMHTVQTPDGFIEMGAQWVHGSAPNPILELLDSLGEIDNSYQYFNKSLTVPSVYPNGVRQNQTIVDTILRLIDNMYDSVFKRPPSDIDRNESFGTALENAFKEIPELDSFNSTLVKSIYDNYMLDMLADLACNSFYEVNAQATNLNGYGGNYFNNPKNGYIRLIEHLTSKLDTNILKLNQQVLSISWLGRLPKVSVLDRITGRIDIHQARFVVTTFPLGVLKADHKMLFTPELPIKRVGAIERLGFGTVNKIFLKFDRVYFNGSSDIRLLWPEGSQLKLESLNSTECNLKGDETFYKSFFNMFSIMPDRPNTLLVFITGEDNKIIEQISDSCLTDVLHELLQLYFPKLNMSRPTITRSKWNSDPLARGSYSFVKLESSLDDIDTIATPLRNKIFFAGEATTTKIGTVHGAYETGLRTAKQINQLL